MLGLARLQEQPHGAQCGPVTAMASAALTRWIPNFLQSMFAIPGSRPALSRRRLFTAAGLLGLGLPLWAMPQGQGASSAAAASAATVAGRSDVPASRTLARIRDTGVVVMGYRPASLPFSYLDGRLKPVGYSVELCERIIDAIREQLQLPDLEVKQIAVNSATRMPLVANGTLDMECGITTHNAERARSQSFSTTTYVAESRLLSRRSQMMRSIEDLRGLTVASTIGTTSLQYLHQLNVQKGLGFRILVGQDDQESFRLLQTGRAVAYAMDDVLLRSLIAQVRDPQEYYIAEQPLSVEPYAIGLPPNDPQFKRLVDGVIASLYRSGEIHGIYQRWFQNPIPPRGLNLQLPMGDAFKRVIAKPTDSPDPAAYR